MAYEQSTFYGIDKYVPHRKRYYTYDNYFSRLPGISPKRASRIIHHVTNNTAYWSLNRRKNREYLYPHFIGYYLKSIKNVPSVQPQYPTDYWSKNRRRMIEHRYPSFFMKEFSVPTYKWSCTTYTDTSGNWTCT